MSKLSDMQNKWNGIQEDADNSHVLLGEATRELESVMVKVELGESKLADVTKAKAALVKAERTKADLEQKLRILKSALKIQRKRDREQKNEADKIRQAMLQAAAAAQMDDLRLEATIALARVAAASSALSESQGFDHTRIGDFCIRGGDNMPSFSEAFDNARHDWDDTATQAKPTLTEVA